MKKTLLLLVFCASISGLMAQKESYDLISFIPPQGWTKEEKQTLILYTIIDQQKRSWCQIGIVKSTISKGTIDRDFDSEWQELVVKNYNPQPAEKTEVLEAEGWKIRSGSAMFSFKGSNAFAILTTFSGYGRCASIVITSNSQHYMNDIDALLGSVELQEVKPADNSMNENKAVSDNNFAFNTTNFDDGWTSTIKEDWVEVAKGNMKVLLHYPKEGTIFPADPAVLTNGAWDILVAPRYSNLIKYKTSYISTYDRPYLGMGYAVENATGKNVFIVFFRQGQTGWIEFIAPDKNTFIQQYKFDPETIQWDSNTELMVPLANMAGYNRFAVAASDFKGKWTSDFTGIQQLYNIYTGQYAGMNFNQSDEEFNFDAGNSYHWKLLVVNGMVGNANYAQVKSSGQFTVPNNWQISFSKIESGPKTYHAFWSCIKGARVLNLLDANTPGSGIYTKYGLAK